jgi:hypothetical protein
MQKLVKSTLDFAITIENKIGCAVSYTTFALYSTARYRGWYLCVYPFIFSFTISLDNEKRK